MTVRWQAALAYALVEQELSVPEPGRPDVAAVLTALSAHGWDAGRIQAHARAVIAAEGVWPHPVPAALRAGTGPAQFHAAVAEARRELDLVTFETKAPSARTWLTADERRLLGEAPPHHVG